ncbi:MAG TPA: hypothetical protein VN698_02245 [Bacteroidia bacterium]|nr:hypothetical protein [Bacteroidia bacterium]
MIHFQFKGKGLLLLVYVFVPFFVMLILTGLFSDYFFNGKLPDRLIICTTGTSLIISGFWNYLTVDEYYIDENGEKQYVYFDNKFMYLDMKIWSYILWFFGGMLLISGLGDFISRLIK